MNLQHTILGVMIVVSLGLLIQVQAQETEPTVPHSQECSKCHDPANYMEPNMLKTQDMVALCQACHEDGVTHGVVGTQYATCIECHEVHNILPLVFETTCLSCHDDLERKGKHKVGSKCYKCHKHLKGFSKVKVK